MMIVTFMIGRSLYCRCCWYDDDVDGEFDGDDGDGYDDDDDDGVMVLMKIGADDAHKVMMMMTIAVMTMLL